MKIINKVLDIELRTPRRRSRARKRSGSEPGQVKEHSRSEAWGFALIHKTYYYY